MAPEEIIAILNSLITPELVRVVIAVQEEVDKHVAAVLGVPQ
jgi:hypothetical protein